MEGRGPGEVRQEMRGHRGGTEDTVSRPANPPRSAPLGAPAVRGCRPDCLALWGRCRLLTLSTARILAQMKTRRGRSSLAELCSSFST